MKWLAWVSEEQVKSVADWLDFIRAGDTTIEYIHRNMAKYATKAHLVDDEVGGYRKNGDGLAGATVCGVEVADDNRGLVRYWFEDTQAVNLNGRCKRCQQIARKEEWRDRAGLIQ